MNKLLNAVAHILFIVLLVVAVVMLMNSGRRS